MKKLRASNNVWVSATEVTKFHEFRDLRSVVSRHIEWENTKIAKFKGRTRWNGVEPDNYTHGIAYERPLFIDGIEHQCWFKHNNVWYGLYIVDDFTRPLYEIFLKENSWWGHWRAHRPHERRSRITRIEYETHLRWGKYSNMTEDEFYYLSGYYTKLIALGADPEWIRERTGDARTDITFEIEEDIDDDV